MRLYEGHHTGRRRKWTAEQQEVLRVLVQAAGWGQRQQSATDYGANGRLADHQPGNGKAVSARDAVQLQALPLQLKKKHPPEAFGKATRKWFRGIAFRDGGDARAFTQTVGWCLVEYRRFS